MDILNSFYTDIMIPECFIVFVSGVPGVGKTTISYELLKSFDEFRIIEETDLIREILRGYNEYIKDEFKNKSQFLFDKVEISDHTKILSFDEAKEQCRFMKKSLEKIVTRQHRRGIPTIINGVHIIPEVLNGIAQNHNIIYINLFIDNEEEIYNRLVNRDPNSYMLNHIPLIYQTNIELYLSTLKLSDKSTHMFNNVNVTTLNIKETINEIANCIKNRLSSC